MFKNLKLRIKNFTDLPTKLLPVKGKLKDSPTAFNGKIKNFFFTNIFWISKDSPKHPINSPSPFKNLRPHFAVFKQRKNFNFFVNWSLHKLSTLIKNIQISMRYYLCYPKNTRKVKQKYLSLCACGTRGTRDTRDTLDP